MKSNVMVASTLAALTAGGLVGEAVISAESAETHCAAPTSCTERPVAVETWSPDMPEHGNATHAPTAQIVETGGTATEALPPYVEDTSAPLPHRWPRRPMTQADESWLGATAGALPPYVEDYSPPLRRRLPRPMPQADEGWLGATAPSPVPLGWM
jgi:hypothetical protein